MFGFLFKSTNERIAQPFRQNVTTMGKETSSLYEICVTVLGSDVKLKHYIGEQPPS